MDNIEKYIVNLLAVCKIQDLNTNMKDNSVKKDMLVAGGSIVGFYLLLIVAGWLDSMFGLTAAYTLVDVASVSLKVATASALAWILKRLVFTNTLGKDFGGVFNEGWAQFSIKEKAQWIIITFLVIFFAVMQASGQ